MEGQTDPLFHRNLLATTRGSTWVDKGKEKSQKSPLQDNIAIYVKHNEGKSGTAE